MVESTVLGMVAESNFKMFKTEFVKGRNFDSLEQLKIELGDYIR